MDKYKQVLQEIEERFGEWLEMAGDQAPALRLHLVCELLIEERLARSFYETQTKRMYAKK